MPVDVEKFLFDDDPAAYDELLADLIRLETERQARQIILIPSESICAAPVRKTLDTCYTNLYAEGYPPTGYTHLDEKELADLPFRLAFYRRYADRRFYKGNAYVNLVESICRRRAAECFATEHVPADQIYANVQALSGAAANLAVYEAFLEIGDTLMCMDLMQGGHLSHGSEFHMSGKRYHIAPYGIDSRTGRLNYGAIRELALEQRPKIIVAGYTSYPWAPDWAQFRAIADECGALLMADIAHPAGMAIAGAYPNPVGYADVTTFTTHKTLMGPRGAVILTTDAEKARAVDDAVFPGEQGGPHVNTIAALAVAFKLAQSEEFKRLQHRIVANAKLLADELTGLGLKLAYGGTDTHLLLLDLNPLRRNGGSVLYGEPAVRILELAGIVANRNTIPGDELTALATGVRLGTPWFTQRGAGEAEIKELARLIHRVVTAIEPFSYEAVTCELPRGKIDVNVLAEVSEQVETLAAKLTPAAEEKSGYPHYPLLVEPGGDLLVRITGERAEAYLQELVTGDLTELKPGEAITSLMLDGEAKVIDEVAVTRLAAEKGTRHGGFMLRGHAVNAKRLLLWLRGHADGYILFEPADVTSKVEGPVVVEQLPADAPEAKLPAAAPATDGKLAGRDARELYQTAPERFALYKPYFVGQSALGELAEPAKEKKEFSWQEKEGELRRTPLFEEHQKLGGKLVPFAGWEMPVRYGSTIEEHNAVRQAAGLFDVAHMGTFEVSGEHAEDFLDLVATNYARWFEVGKSYYSYLLDPEGRVIDDIMVYHLAKDRFLMVVNAANEAKAWNWLNLVNSHEALIDRELTMRRGLGAAVLKNLKDPAWGDERKVDLALQGPASLKVLLKLAEGEAKEQLRRLDRTECGEMKLAGLDVVVSRTGYTGEPVGFEIFVHPDKAAEFWRAILDAGEEFGVQAVGLGARDSLRIEAGLPLYGHELEGPEGVSPAGAVFAGYVKLHKPFFIGKRAYMETERQRDKEVIRFQVPQKGTKPLKPGDTLVDPRGRFLGRVTSCAVDGSGLQVGQAYVLRRLANTQELNIYPLPPGAKKELPTPLTLRAGDRMTMPVQARLMERFPLRNCPVSAE